MELHEYQKPYYEALLGMSSHAVSGNRVGARRAWVDLPLGYGKTHVVCEAAKALHFEHQGAPTILYVTQKSMFHHVKQLLGAASCRPMNPTGDILVGVELCSQTMLCRYHDTAVQYRDYDLVIVDLCFDPLSGRGGPTLAAAMQTLLRTAKRLWIVGADV